MKKGTIILIVIFFILHELGHVVAFVTLGIEFTPVIFPEFLGFYHVLGFDRLHTGVLWKEFYIKIACPIILQAIYIILVTKNPRHCLAFLMSYADTIAFTM